MEKTFHRAVAVLTLTVEGTFVPLVWISFERRSLVFVAISASTLVGLTCIFWLSALVSMVNFARDKYEAEALFRGQFHKPLEQTDTPETARRLGDCLALEEAVVLEGWRERLADYAFWCRVDAFIKERQPRALSIPGRREFLVIEPIAGDVRLQRVAWQSWWDAPTVIMVGVFLLALLLFCVYCAVLFCLRIVMPLRVFNELCDEHLSRGQIRDMPFLPRYYADEVGVLAQTFNRTLIELKTLVSQTQTVAGGNLAVRLEGQGELPESFSQMMVSLNSTVKSIALESTQLDRIGQELLSGVREQETSGEMQCQSMVNLQSSADELKSVAHQVATEVQDISGYANSTARGAAAVFDQTSTLSWQVSSVQEELRSVRGVARRSRMLALNARIEARNMGDKALSVYALATEAAQQSELIDEVSRKLELWVQKIEAVAQTCRQSAEESSMLANSTMLAAENISLIIEQQVTEAESLSQTLRETLGSLEGTQSISRRAGVIAQQLVEKSVMLKDRVGRFQLS